ncbi:LmbU family transcriptional regulator [Micromonospora echinospora]
MRAGRRLSALATSTAWCLGDWILFGQARYGEKYREAVETVGLDYQTLRNYTWVARAVAMPRRRENLSFQHHAEVASLSDTEQDYWLRRAEENRWSRNELRRQVRAAALGRDDAGPPSVQVRLNAVADRLDRWRAAADRSGTTVEAWLVKCADAAADQLLDVPEESMT